MKAIRKLAASAWPILFSALLISNHVALAAGPFTIAPQDVSTIHMDAPVASVYWSLETESLHVGTLNGKVASWNVLFTGNKPAITGPFGARAVDAFAVFTITGRDNVIATGGFARQPLTTFLPGAIVGTIPLGNPSPKALTLASCADTKRIAILCDDGLHVFNGTVVQPNLTVAGQFDFIAWLHSPTANDTSRLATYSRQDGQLRMWRAGAITIDNSFPVSLPRVSSTVSGVRSWRSVALTSLIGVPQEKGLAAGDALGNVRFWKAIDGPTSVQLAPSVLSAFAEDASTLVEYRDDGTAGKIVAYKLPDLSTSTPMPTRKGKPSALRCFRDQVGAQRAAVAWSDDPYDVELCKFGSLQPEKFQANPAPVDRIRVIEARLDGSQLAGAVKGKGVCFFESTAPSDPMPASPSGVSEDNAIVDLRFTRDGNWLIAVGDAVSLYDSKRRQLMAKSDSLNISTNEVVADLVLDAPVPGQHKLLGKLLVGTVEGALELWNVTIETGNPPKIQVTSSIKEATATETAIRRVQLNGNRAIAVCEKEIVVFEFDPAKPQAFVAVERVEGDNFNAAALNGAEVFYRLEAAGAHRPIAAHGVLKISDRPIRQLVRGGNDLTIAADDAGQLFAYRGPNNLSIGGQTDKIDSLTISSDGTFLLAGVEAGGKFKIRMAQIAAARVTFVGDPLEFGDHITSILFGKENKTAIVGQKDGRLYRIDLSQPKSARIDLRLADSRSALSSAAWMPSATSDSTATDGALDFERLLTIEGNGQAVALRNLQVTGGPKIAVDSSDVSPWYASTLFGDKSRSLVLSGADGQLRVVTWPFPRPLANNFAPDSEPLSAAAGSVASKGPLYAVVHSAEFKGELAGGAAGELYKQQSAAEVVNTADPHKEPIYSLGVHTTGIVFASGQADLAPPAPDPRLLTVWPKDLNVAKARSWPGHSAPVVAVAFTIDGKELASVDHDRKLIIWNCDKVTTDKVEPPPHTELDLGAVGASSLAWLGSDFLAIGLDDGRVVLYHVTKSP